MDKRWFMSYVQVYQTGDWQVGHHVYVDNEHPIARAIRWSATIGQRSEYPAGRFRCIVLAFQEVDDSVPECDDLGHIIRR